MKLLARRSPCRAKIVNFQGLSSHADQDHLLNWINQFTPAKPTHVFVVHGDREVAPPLPPTLRPVALPYAPQYTEVYDLLENRILEQGYLPEPRKKAFEGAPRISLCLQAAGGAGRRAGGPYPAAARARTTRPWPTLPTACGRFWRSSSSDTINGAAELPWLPCLR